MVRTVKVDMGDDNIFLVQENMSFVQQNEFMAIVEGHLDIIGMRKWQQKQAELARVAKANGVDMIKAEIPMELIKTSPMKFNNAMSMYLLTAIIIEPKITLEALNDPDDPNVVNFRVLGAEMAELGMKFLSKTMNQKKTPKK